MCNSFIIRWVQDSQTGIWHISHSLETGSIFVECGKQIKTHLVLMDNPVDVYNNVVLCNNCIFKETGIQFTILNDIEI